VFTWRRLLGVTANQRGERAGMSAPTLSQAREPDQAELPQRAPPAGSARWRAPGLDPYEVRPGSRPRRPGRPEAGAPL